MNNFIEKLICINRVSKTVKGGRIFSFTALTVIGNNNGSVGYGYGKSKEIPVAIQKSIEKAKNNIVNIIINKKTILYRSYGKYLCSKVFIKPACEGTGIIAGNVIRSIFEVSGIKNIFSKIYGSTNPINVVKATINAINNINLIDFINKNRLNK
ncbi:30S ribosomal protein S5 [endosymbiont of Pachyrhynchus infernalis]|uniref:30S ribosomal protein S5 n=1 Tax=endosymbiont of Pachyrhynchus infernalis TaxID=1971488 RepID=UPI000DC73F85|nr:30S ribosomal protein S5 [endosymbiont of Pachyrhynchus infernalis]BBA84849.1 30S ribosomal protein S5 [endosymbiont of Pachyrhynchus infernalis]